MIAALYVERGGPYFTMPGVDPWDLARDARKYDGPYPVVAHPPCGAYGDLAAMHRKSDSDCAPLAVAQVRKFGGILEHPHRSKLWPIVGLPVPGQTDDFGGFTVQIDQVAWGHVARKRTRLYIVGIGQDLVESTIRTGGVATHWVCGSRNERRKPTGGVRPAHIKVCSSQQRRRTPPLFAEWLVSLAASAWTFGG